MYPISAYKYINENLPRQLLFSVQSKAYEIAKNCFQLLEKFFSWVAGSFSKWLCKTDVVPSCENPISSVASSSLPIVPINQGGLDEQEGMRPSMVFASEMSPLSSVSVDNRASPLPLVAASLEEPLNFGDFFSSLELQCSAISSESDLVEQAMKTLKLAHTQEECAAIRGLLEEKAVSLEPGSKLFSCIEMSIGKEQALDPNLSNSQKVLTFALLAQKSDEFRSVIAEEDFSSIEPINASYEEGEGTIAPYDLFLLALHSSPILASLQWPVERASPIGLMISQFAVGQILALVNGQRLGLTEDEQAHLLLAAEQILLNQQEKEALFPHCLPFLESEERTLGELAQFIGLTPPSFLQKMDNILHKALWKVIFKKEEIDISTIKFISTSFCSPPFFPRAAKAFCLLMSAAVAEDEGLIEELDGIPFLKLYLTLSEKNADLLHNPFILRNWVRCHIVTRGSDDFYRRVFGALQGCSLEKLSIRFDKIPLELLKNEYRENQEILLACLKEDSRVFQCASDALKRDREFVLKAVQSNGLTLEFASEEFQRDREIVLAAVQRNGWALCYASEECKRDREIVLAAVQSSGWALYGASDALKSDPEIVLAAVQRNGLALPYASDALKNDKEVVLKAVQSNGLALEYASEECKRDKEIVLAAIQNDVRALRFASDELKGDRDIVLAVVQRGRLELCDASDALKNDPEFVLAAVQSSGCTLQYASDGLKNDRDIVLAAVQRDVRALQYASEECKGDREIVLKAIQSSGWMLSYASEELKNDKEVVLAAVQSNGLALRHASDECKRDREIALAADLTEKFICEEVCLCQ